MSNASSNCSPLFLSRLSQFQVLPATPLDHWTTEHAVRHPYPTPSSTSFASSSTSPRKQEPKQRQWLTSMRCRPNLSGEGAMIGDAVSGACFESVNPQNACPTPWSELEHWRCPRPSPPHPTLAGYTEIAHVYLPVCLL